MKLDDLRQAVRSLIRRPAVALAGVVSLAGGIAAAVLLFAAADPVLFRPLPFRDPDRLVRLFAREMGGAITTTLSYPAVVSSAATPLLSGLAAYTAGNPVHLSTGRGGPELVDAGIVDGSFFDLLGVAPSLGRLIGRSDTAPVVVLSHAFHRRRFGADPSVVGSAVRINGRPFTVIGVAPRGFAGADLQSASDVWLPLAAASIALPELAGETPLLSDRRLGWLDAVGRLAPDATLPALQSHLDALARSGVVTPPPGEAPVSSLAVPLRRSALGSDGGVPTVRLAWGLLVAAGLIFTLAVAVAASLLVVRAERRRADRSVRASLGATPGRLVAPLVLESLLVAGAGALLGLGLAATALALLRPTASASSLPMSAVRIGAREAAVAALLALVAGLAAAVLPAIRSLRGWRDPRSVAATVRRSRLPLGGAFVVVQVSVSAVLLLGAGLLARTLAATRALDPGFDPSHVAVGSLDVARQGYAAGAGQQALERILERVRAIPGVRAAALGRTVPVQRSGMLIKAPRGHEGKLVDFDVVTPDYFRALGIPLREGRDFTEGDRKGSPAVAIVNETYARLFLPAGPVAGQRLRDGGPGGREVEIVGVTRTARYRSLREEPRPILYVPFAQSYMPGMTLVVRADGEPARALPAVASAVAEVDPDLPLRAAQPLADRNAGTMGEERLLASLLSSFGAVALVLAAIGLFSVVSLATDLRRHELGIRLAVGARPRDLLTLVLRQGAVLGALGLAAGAAGAVPLLSLLSDVLFGVTATDLATWIAVAALLLVVCVTASLGPALDAGRLDPARTLRSDA